MPDKSVEVANLAGQFDADATLLGNRIETAEAVRIAAATLRALPDKYSMPAPTPLTTAQLHDLSP